MNDTRTDDTVIDMIETATEITVGTAIATCATVSIMIATVAIAGMTVLIVFISTSRCYLNLRVMKTNEARLLGRTARLRALLI